MEAKPKQITPEDLNQWLSSETTKLTLLDVREETELKIAKFPRKVIHLPLSKASNWIEELKQILPNDQPIIVICHAGVRSLHFGTWLINQDWGYDVFNLEGGIDAWSLNIDQTIPRY